MVFRQNPRVTIGTTDFTQHAIGRIAVNGGRRTVYERPNAGYATVELIDVDGIPEFRVAEQLQVFIDRAAFIWDGMSESWASVGSEWETVTGPFGVSEPIFTGTVSDFRTDVTPTADGPIVTHSVQAVGPLAVLNRRQIYTTGRVAENDGERMLNILTTALGAGEVDPDLIDDGVFGLAAVPAEDAGYNALAIAQDTGFSGEGVLFETEDGLIGYSDANRRLENERTKVVAIPFAVLAREGVTLVQQLADITNAVTVEYDSGAVSEEDATSIARFGRYETELTTTLADLSNAENRAFQFLNRHATPRSILDELRFNLLSVDVDLLNDLLAIRPSDAIEVTGVPGRLGFTRFRGFVEGFRLDADPFAAELTLVVSDRLLSVGALRWEQVDGTIAWQDVDPTLTWDDAFEVTT